MKKASVAGMKTNSKGISTTILALFGPCNPGTDPAQEQGQTPFLNVGWHMHERETTFLILASTSVHEKPSNPGSCDQIVLPLGADRSRKR